MSDQDQVVVETHTIEENKENIDENNNANEEKDTLAPLPKRERKPLPRRREMQRKASLRKFAKRDIPSQLTSSFSHKAEIGNDPGLEIWKLVDADTLERVPKRDFGTFLIDKAYILLQTRLMSNLVDKEYHLHTWFGDVVKTDEVMCASCSDKGEELEAILGEKPIVVHREVQGHESSEFMSYFRAAGGVKYISPVSLNKVVIPTTVRSRLYHLKGRRYVRVKEVEVSYQSLNKGDVFILDSDDVIYQWNGSSASRMEKAKGLDLTVRLRDERAAKAKVVVIDEKGDDVPEFWEALGGRGEIADADSAGSDADYEVNSTKVIKLFRISDEDGTLTVDQVEPEDGLLSTRMLNPKQCFILDCETELFVWTGKESPEIERTAALASAEDFLTNEERPTWTRITKMMQNCETALFKDKFKKGTWGEYVETYELKIKNKIAKTQRQEVINVDEMHHPEKYKIAKEDSFSNLLFPMANDDERSTVKLWFVKNHTKHELDESQYGIFYAGNCYILLYSQKLIDGGVKNVLYFWQGRHASQDDKGSSALLAKEVGAELGRNCVQTRAIQNKEPDHFLSHFKGKMVVKKGRMGDQRDESEAVMFQVRGHQKIDTRAAQVDTVASSLDSNDSFILSTPTHNYVWHGTHATTEERSFSVKCANRIFPDREFEEITEESEPEQFWEILGGQTKYVKAKRNYDVQIKSRLFQCSNNTGVFKVMELPNFSQDDLEVEDVMILDTGLEVFVWIGARSSEQEQTMSLETAMEYMQTGPVDRSENPLYVVHGGNEPPIFTSHFLGWDAQKSKEAKDVYTNKLTEVMQKVGVSEFKMNSTLDLLSLNSNNYVIRVPDKRKSFIAKTPATTTSTPKPTTTTLYTTATAKTDITTKPVSTTATTTTTTATTTTNNGADGATIATYPYDRLKKKPTPEDVDAKNLHYHLTPEEFEMVFKMDKTAFDKLPAWRKLEKRKLVGLF